MAARPLPLLLQPDRFSVVRVYRGTNGERVVHQRDLTWGECVDEKRFPLGLLKDDAGREFVYTVVLTECL